MKIHEFVTESDQPTRIKLGGGDPAAQAWIDRVYQLYPQTFQNNHVMPLGGSGDDQEFAMFELVPSLSRRGAVEVKWFQAYPLRQGVGSRAMQQLQKLAREDGISLTLFPWDKGQVSQSKLTKFYRGQGFSPTARGSKAMQWTPDQPSVSEGKLEESAVFLNPTTVVVGQAHGQPLELSPDTLKKIQAIAAKHGAWYEGNGTDRSYTKGQIDRYVGSWDDEVAKTASSNDPKWLYVLFANVDENNRVQRVGVDPKDTIFNRLLATAKDNSFQGIGYTSQALQKFLQMASEGKYDFVKMSQQPATQQNLTRFLKAGEALMWPSNWEQYPNRAGKIAKAATVDVRDQYLATRKAGVYVTGSGHLKAVQNITGQPSVTEGIPQPGPSSGAPKQFGPDAKIETRQMTVKQIISSIPSVPYYNNVVDDWDAKDYSWGVTKKVIEYATYLKDHPESLAKLPPAIVLNGKFEDGAHRVSAIWLLQQRMDPKNPLWANAKLNVQFVKTDVEENFADGKVKGNSRPGRVKRAGASCDGSVTDLRKRAKNASGEKAKMYHWCANMKSGRKK